MKTKSSKLKTKIKNGQKNGENEQEEKVRWL